MSSRDGGNFEEVACWRSPSQLDVAFVEHVMFDEIQSVRAIAIVMKAPRPWQFFGLNEVQLMVEPYAFMIVSGQPSAAGEICLVARNGVVAGERCFEAIAAGDGREVFTQRSDGSIVSSATGKCLTILDTPPGRRLTMEACLSTLEARDGRSYWERAASGTLQTKGAGSLCVVLESLQPSLETCAESETALSEASKMFFVAVPAFDARASMGVQNGAALLKAAVARQRALLSNLQDLWPRLQSCKYVSDAPLNHSGTLSLAQRLPAASAVGTLLPRHGQSLAFDAVVSIYGALGVDMANISKLMSESASTLSTASSQLVQSR